MADDETPQISLGITPTQAYELYTLLATDDEFRERLEREPTEVLREYNIEITPPEAFPDDIKLPPKEAFQEALKRFGEPEYFRTAEVAARLRGQFFKAIPMKFPGFGYAPGDGPDDTA